MPPGPTSSEAGHVFPVGTCTQNRDVHHIVYRAGHTDQHRQKHSITHIDTNRTKTVILFLSVAVCVCIHICKCIYIYTYIWTWCTLQQLSSPRLPLDPSLSRCYHLDVWVPKAAVPLQFLLQTIAHAHRKTHMQADIPINSQTLWSVQHLSGTPLVPLITASTVVSPLETHTPAWITGHFTYSTGSSGLIFANDHTCTPTLAQVVGTMETWASEPWSDCSCWDSDSHTPCAHRRGIPSPRKELGRNLLWR